MYRNTTANAEENIESKREQTTQNNNTNGMNVIKKMSIT